MILQVKNCHIFFTIPSFAFQNKNISPQGFGNSRTNFILQKNPSNAFVIPKLAFEN
jgi:hypothetical protein